MDARERRIRAARAVDDAIGCRSRFENVKHYDDRITFMFEGDAVTVVVVDARPLVAPDATTCPFCGSSNIKVSKQSGTHPQRGCLDCDQWLDPLRLE